MPVVGTPVDLPVDSTVQCYDQINVRPKVTRVDGVESPARTPSVSVNQGQEAIISWTMRNQDGDPVDLTVCGFESDTSSSSSSSSSSSDSTGKIVVRILEVLAASSTPSVEITARVIAAGAGIVEARLTSAVVAQAGIYRLEWGALDRDGALIFSNQGYLVVNRGQFGACRQEGPPTIPEIRLHMRDSGAEDNYLLDTVEFDLAELAACIERPVLLWNNTMEFVGCRHTTQSFPYRSQWLDAVVGYLYLLAAQNYRRNNQQYNAGGTAMNDKAKAPEYENKGRELIAEYKNFVKVRKGQINMESAFGGTSERI